MLSLFRSRQSFGAGWATLCCALVFMFAGAIEAYGQCPAVTNRGWAQNTIVRYAFFGSFTEEHKRQIRAAAAEWSRANSINNSKVSFIEDTSAQNFALRFQTGALAAGNPAVFNATYDAATGLIKSATITYDPNNTFPGTTLPTADPSQAGYSTIVTKLILHEMGHLMGLDHPAVPANLCDQPDGATVMNYSCGVNDQGNNIPTTIPACDQNTINSETIYQPITLPTPSVQVETSSTAISVNEGAGRAQVTVTRTGNHTTAVNVDYSTADNSGLNPCNNITGLASSRCDYALTVGTLRFASGETSKTITIPLVDDGYGEGNETFRLTLTNPSGANLGAATSNITITDNEPVTAFDNPIDTVPFFVRQHYIDLLGREPDPTGFQGWQDILNGCGTTVAQPCDRIEVSSAFFRSE
ncbi:MAG TPA: Calx-beta domain-containing protein, partial [Pyrinomonadaceae bacterium]|nr:Calx-beta domain-containing protein [Pyrinomonadaceae bacterium]